MLEPRAAGQHGPGDVLGLVGTAGLTPLLKQRVGARCRTLMGSKPQLQPDLGEPNRSSASELEGPQKHVGTRVPWVLRTRFLPSWEKGWGIWARRNKRGRSAPEL